MADNNVDIGGTIGGLFGAFDWVKMSNMIAIVIVIFVLLVVGGIFFFLWMMKKRFNKSVVIFENISGQGYQPTRKDTAMLVKLGDGGEEVLYLRKHKVYRSAYGKKMGTNQYWFVIGEDGYWYNANVDDFDKTMKSLGMKPIDRDMRYMHVALRRNLAERYNKTKWWEKYGGIILFFGLILITGVLTYLLFDKYITITDKVGSVVSAAAEVTKEAARIIGGLDSLKGSGGITPA